MKYRYRYHGTFRKYHVHLCSSVNKETGCWLSIRFLTWQFGVVSLVKTLNLFLTRAKQSTRSNSPAWRKASKQSSCSAIVWSDRLSNCACFIPMIPRMNYESARLISASLRMGCRAPYKEMWRGSNRSQHRVRFDPLINFWASAYFPPKITRKALAALKYTTFVLLFKFNFCLSQKQQFDSNLNF